MKIIKYTLLGNGKVPESMVDGGYFPKYNGGQSPQDYDLIGFSYGWTGLGEFTTKAEFETYVKSFCSDFTDIHGITYYIQDIIDNFWSRKNAP